MSRPASLHPHYRSFITTTNRSASATATVLNVSQFLLLDTLPLAPLPNYPAECSVVSRLPTFRTEAADQAHATCMPDTAWPATRAPARLIPEFKRYPGFDVSPYSRHVSSGSLSLVFLAPI